MISYISDCGPAGSLYHKMSCGLAALLSQNYEAELLRLVLGILNRQGDELPSYWSALSASLPYRFCIMENCSFLLGLEWGLVWDLLWTARDAAAVGVEVHGASNIGLPACIRKAFHLFWELEAGLCPVTSGLCSWNHFYYYLSISLKPAVMWVLGTVWMPASMANGCAGICELGWEGGDAYEAVKGSWLLIYLPSLSRLHFFFSWISFRALYAEDCVTSKTCAWLPPCCITK